MRPLWPERLERSTTPPMCTSLPAIRLERGELARALALGLAVATLCALAFQSRMYGDGPGLVGFCALGTGQSYHHVLLLWVARGLNLVWLPDDPFLWPRALMLLGAGLCAAASYLLARGFGATRGGALGAILLLVTAPGFAFYATTIEIPILQAGVVGVVACVVLYAPWERPALAFALVCGSFPLVFLGHQSGALLGAGVVALVAHARARRAPSFSWRVLLLGVGPLLLLVLLVTMALVSYARGEGFQLDFQGEVDFIEAYTQASTTSRFFTDGLFVPLACVGPLALVGAWRLRAERAHLLVLALLLLPSLGFFAWWAVPERGGYAVGLFALLAPLVARALPAGRAAWLVLAPCLFVNLGMSWHAVGEYDGRFDPAERKAQLAQVLDGSGVIINGHDHAPPAAIWWPEVREVALTIEWIAVAAEHGQTAAQFAEFAAQYVASELETGPLVLDLSWREVRGHRTLDGARPYWEALIALLQERFSTRLVAHPDWPLLVLER